MAPWMSRNEWPDGKSPFHRFNPGSHPGYIADASCNYCIARIVLGRCNDDFRMWRRCPPGDAQCVEDDRREGGRWSWRLNCPQTIKGLNRQAQPLDFTGSGGGIRGFDPATPSTPWKTLAQSPSSAECATPWGTSPVPPRKSSSRMYGMSIRA